MKTYKIAILGCENSHADAFIKLIMAGEYEGVEVVGVYTDDESANARMRESYGVYTAESYDEFVGAVDGIMVTARHGDNHLKYLLPYLEYGIPVFIDKPATASVADAKALAALLKKHGNRYTGGSSCIHTEEVKALEGVKASNRTLGGTVRAPIDLKNPYGGFWFYSQHLVQIMQQIFGYYPEAVTAFVREGQINCLYSYAEYDVYTEFVEGNYCYYASVSTASGVVGSPINVTEAIYKYEMDEYYKILTGGESPVSASDFFAPVFVIDATLRSIETGKTERIERL